MAVPSRRRFTTDEYHLIAEAGVLGEDDRVELIDGEIVEMSPTNGRHVECLGRLTRTLVLQIGARAIVHAQSAIRLSNFREPRPDIAVVRDRAYMGELPTADDVFLVMEVADSSRQYDRNTKLPMYAEAGILESWLFDVVSDVVERHTEPRDCQYRVVARAKRGESLASTVVPDVVITVDDVLGKPQANR